MDNIQRRNIQITHDAEGKSIVLINDIIFKGKRAVKWEDVEKYLKQYVGEFYTIAETNDVIYIGSDMHILHIQPHLREVMQKRRQMLLRG